MTLAEFIAFHLMSRFRAVNGGVVVDGNTLYIIYTHHTTVVMCYDTTVYTREMLERINSDNGLKVKVKFQNTWSGFTNRKRCTESQCNAFAWMDSQQCGSIGKIRTANTANLAKSEAMLSCLQCHHRSMKVSEIKKQV